MTFFLGHAVHKLSAVSDWPWLQWHYHRHQNNSEHFHTFLCAGLGGREQFITATSWASHYHTFPSSLGLGAPVPALPGPADARVQDHSSVVTAARLLQLGEGAHTEAQRGPRHGLLHPRPGGPSRAPVRPPAPVGGEAGQRALGRGGGGRGGGRGGGGGRLEEAGVWRGGAGGHLGRAAAPARAAVLRRGGRGGAGAAGAQARGHGGRAGGRGGAGVGLLAAVQHLAAVRGRHPLLARVHRLRHRWLRFLRRFHILEVCVANLAGRFR